MTRNSLGLIVQSTNGLGNQTSDAYDAKGNLINTQDSLAGAYLGQSRTTASARRPFRVVAASPSPLATSMATACPT